MNSPTFAPLTDTFRLAGDGTHPNDPDYRCHDFMDDGADEQMEEEAAELAVEYMADPLKVEEAHEWLDGTMSGDWYSAVERTLAQLHQTAPSDLSGSGVLARLYKLSNVIGSALEDKIGEMAAAEVEARFARFEANSPDGEE